jgi:hypothetical protein
MANNYTDRKCIATLSIYNLPEMEKTELKRVIDWLRMHAKQIKKKDLYGKRFSARIYK